jgi:hypothetical protein
MDKPADLGKAHLRVVRESEDLAPVVTFCRDGRGIRGAVQVLPAEYDWNACFDHRQVAMVRNDCANRDFPVAYLSRALRWYGMRDIGTAGVEGFRVGRAEIREVRFHAGGHGSMLGEPTLKSFAHFIRTGSVTRLEETLVPRDSHSGVFGVGSRFAPALALLGLIALSVAAAWWISYFGGVEDRHSRCSGSQRAGWNRQSIASVPIHSWARFANGNRRCGIAASHIVGRSLGTNG